MEVDLPLLRKECLTSVLRYGRLDKGADDEAEHAVRTNVCAAKVEEASTILAACQATREESSNSMKSRSDAALAKCCSQEGFLFSQN